WVTTNDHVVTDAPLEISSWSVSRAARTARFDTTIDAWPLSCASDGLCAWEARHDDEHAVIVRNATAADGPLRRFPCAQDDQVVARAVARTGQRLALAVNRPEIRQWNLRTGGALAALPLQTRPQGLLGIDISRSWTPVPRFIVPREGMATAVEYSP